MGQRMQMGRRCLPCGDGRIQAQFVIQEHGGSLARAAQRVDVSRPTVRKWVGRYEAKAGFAGRPATPHPLPHRLPPARDRRDSRAARSAAGWPACERLEPG